jgi:2-polyprenyl-3-methyl-5-hydroxy-6-metoxy-1,4-benzoquinol methylase
VSEVSAAYGRRATEYTEKFGTMAATDPRDRDVVARWAARRTGPVIDAGCGPGHWTSWLAEQGCAVEGVDATAEFVAHARVAWPSVRFRTARLDALGVPDSSLDGVLAWYSLIHTEPAAVDAVLDEFARCVVVTAYTWSLTGITERLEASGFDVVGHHRRAGGGARPHLDVLARRR